MYHLVKKEKNFLTKTDNLTSFKNLKKKKYKYLEYFFKNENLLASFLIETICSIILSNFKIILNFI